MPIYEYKCSNCGAKLEKLQKMSDEPLKDCPECGKATLTKLVSASGFILKGTGWYATDFKNIDKPAVNKPAGETADGASKAGNTDKAADQNSNSAKNSASADSTSANTASAVNGKQINEQA